MSLAIAAVELIMHHIYSLQLDKTTKLKIYFIHKVFGFDIKSTGVSLRLNYPKDETKFVHDRMQQIV